MEQTHNAEYSITTSETTSHHLEGDHDSKLQLNDPVKSGSSSSTDPMSSHQENSNENTDTALNNTTLRQPHHKPTAKEGLMAIVKSSWINPLVIFIPFGIASHFVWSPTITFVLNFIAIVPLAKLLGFATEELALYTGEVVGGLLNASFGNAVELIVSIIALTKNLVIVVQASMLGSILSNLLLVLGMCFWLGGYRYKEQTFNVTAAQTSASLLFIATASLLLPAAFYGSSFGTESTATVNSDILIISRATSIILLIVYFAYLFFQLKTHQHLFLAEASTEEHRPLSRPIDHENALEQQQEENDQHEEEETPQMPFWMSIILLLVTTALVAVCAEFLVSAIEVVVEQWHISQTFVGLILLPIVGNAAEHVTAVTVAYKNKMDLALGVAVGSSMQIALLVTPLMVIIGWGINVEMSLYFNIYETAVMFIAVVMVNYLIMDGKSNWLEGLMLFAIYIIIAISFYYYPDNASGGLTSDNSASKAITSTAISGH
ncbi:Sodium/calcium exchanger protein-domain-containing protein [Absidia repens]|uniref:Vacuolar calcium ion transporter n=1 Tax=Absidia repens TaxID=90262 RepID=A0A1X2IZ87_9FUNG|nr:Sodium/calcium exchanger protein-domain-containing protein [Absidia repens]